MNKQTITAVRVDLADARKTRDWYIEKYRTVLDQRNSLLGTAIEGLHKLEDLDLGDTPVSRRIRAAIKEATCQ